MITKKEVQHIAKLARLGLTEKEIEKFQEELSSILGYIDKLKKIDVSKVNPTSHPLSVENITRKDEGLMFGKRLIPGYLKVKRIFSDNGSN